MTCQIELAPRSVDRVRLIRRSMRCLVFGALGSVPVLGLGLAFQALRLRRVVFRELGLDWRVPPIYWLWPLALVAFWNSLRLLPGWSGVVALGLALVCLQSFLIWRCFPEDSGGVWNPGDAHLRWGVIMAYGGIFGSLVVVTLLVARLSQMGF